MKVCFICSEIFAWGKYGGFGRATRILARELGKKGVSVSAVVPMREGQRPIEELDGTTIYGFPMYRLEKAYAIFKQLDADIFHSEQPSLCSYLAQRAQPRRKHIVTFRDPKGISDWWMELRRASLSKPKTLVAAAYENNFFVNRAIARMDALFCATNSLQGKVRSVYPTSRELGNLNTPVFVPEESEIKKSTVPTVCFLARFDKRKRPELFFELAPRFPKVRFVAVGSSQDKKWQRHLEETYGSLENVDMIGFVDQFTSDLINEILSESWILVNTASREGLPTSFLEALAFKCAILSSVNPENMAVDFGVRVANDEYAAGLEHLLENDFWRTQGEKAYPYVKTHYEIGMVIDQHIAAYSKLLKTDFTS